MYSKTFGMIYIAQIAPTITIPTQSLKNAKKIYPSLNPVIEMDRKVLTIAWNTAGAMAV